MKKPSPKNSDKESALRFKEAEKSLKDLLQEIAPFIRSHKPQKHTSTGQWIDSDSIALLSAVREDQKTLS